MTSTYQQIVRTKIDNAVRLSAPRLYSRDRAHIVDAVMLTVLDNGNQVWLAAKEAQPALATEARVAAVFDPAAPRHLRAIPSEGDAS